MTDTLSAEARTKTCPDRRTRVRFLVAGLAAVISVLYYLIGLGVITVADDATGMLAFGLIAGTAFLGAAGVALAIDRRVVWWAGILAQTFIIWAYFDLASIRTPSFEFWGILIRVLQVLVLGALIYLAIRPKTRVAVLEERVGQRALIRRHDL
jgi:hypothetical protein